MTSSATIRQFRHFVALAETGTFTGAADQCHLSQSALSRSIAALEDDLGVALVDRVGKKANLTAVGLAVLEHARHVVADADELTRCVTIYAQGETGRFRLGVGASPAALLVDPLLVFVAHRYPKLRFTLSRGPVEEQVSSLRARKLDAILVDLRSVLPTPDLSIDPMADMGTGLMCRQDHPLTKLGRAIVFDDLLGFPIASTHWSDELARLMVSKFGPRAHPDELINICCEDVTSLLQVAIRSDAVLMVVLATGRKLIERRQLQILDLPVSGLESKFGLVRLSGRSVPTFYAHLREFIAEQFSAHDSPMSAPSPTSA